jgi:polysaccharide pyruvyl transferase WcaK-like protein
VTRTAGSPRRAAPRIGLFGILAAGNIGNDASMEAILRYLRDTCPGAEIDAMTSGAASFTARYGLPAIPMHWHQKYENGGALGRARVGGAARAPRADALATLAKALGLGAGLVIDAARTLAWVRRHDVVIVPGAGVLETTVLMRPWEDPYTWFLLSAAGRLGRTKVALVSVGANVIKQPLTRWLFTAAARLAHYRSYRDTMSREAMRENGLDVTRDHVYRDVVFGFPPEASAGDSRTVAVGVMAYYGNNDERGQAAQLHAAYVAAMKRFVRWLADDGRQIRFFVGDTGPTDGLIVDELLADLRDYQPGLEPGRAVAVSATSWNDMMRAMAPACAVVAIRYHNVLCGLQLGKPTMAIAYGGKHETLMADMGLSEFCLPAAAVDGEQLIERFTELERRAEELRRQIAERNRVNAGLVGQQFAELTAVLLGDFTDGGRRAAPSGLAASA